MTGERYKIEEEIKRTDVEIDELVYKLYGITGEEKKIIGERSNNPAIYHAQPHSTSQKQKSVDGKIA